MKSPYGSVADAYLNRPTYPTELFDFLESCSPRTETVWDVGCGSGQASTYLARYFDRVVASDSSIEQLQRANPHPRIRFENWSAERSRLEPGSVDCICAFMAAHWFNLDQFYKEARRVGVKDGVIALFCYGEPFVAEHPVVSEVLADISGKIGAFGGPAIQRMRDGYKNLPFPFFDEVTMPPMSAKKELTGHQMISYFRSRASVIDYYHRTGVDLGLELKRHLTAKNLCETTFLLCWPLAGRIAPVHAMVTSHATKQAAGSYQ